MKILVLIIFALLGGGHAYAGSKALIVLDMQYAFSEAHVNTSLINEAKLKEALGAQVEAIELAKSLDIPILVVEYEGHGPIYTEILSALGNYKKQRRILKSTDDLFSRANKYLDEPTSFFDFYDIHEIYVMGANGGACVESTILGAIQRGIKVSGYSIGILDFNQPEVLYPYNWGDAYSFHGEPFAPLPENKYQDITTYYDLQVAISGNDNFPKTAEPFSVFVCGRVDYDYSALDSDNDSDEELFSVSTDFMRFELHEITSAQSGKLQEQYRSLKDDQVLNVCVSGPFRGYFPEAGYNEGVVEISRFQPVDRDEDLLSYFRLIED